MENTVRTVYSAYLQTCLLLNRPVVLLPGTTLNEKLGVQSGVLFGQDETPNLGYAAIGNGGHKMVMGANGISRPEPVQHLATDAALYNQIPFILRTLNNDITAVEREKYALRRVEEHGGISYIAYYLKRLNFSNVSAQMDYKTVNSGVTTTTPFVPNNSNLNPIPPNLANTGVNVTTGDYVSATAKIPFTLNTDEVEEVINVSNIIYGDSGYAIISEIALCSGVDKIVAAAGAGGGNFNLNESIGTQVASFVNGFFAMNFSNAGLAISFDLGATEPLFILTNQP